MSSIMAGILFGIVGWYLFKAGRQDGNLPFIGIGIALMVYPYLVSGPLWTWGTGVALLLAAYFTR